MDDSSELSSEQDSVDAVELFNSYQSQRAQKMLELTNYLKVQRQEELAILRAYNAEMLPEIDLDYNDADTCAIEHIEEMYSGKNSVPESESKLDAIVDDDRTDRSECLQQDPVADEALQREIEKLNYEMMLEMKALSNVSTYIQSLTDFAAFSAQVENSTHESKMKQKKLAFVKALSYSALARSHATPNFPTPVPILLSSPVNTIKHVFSYERYHRACLDRSSQFVFNLCQTNALLLQEQRYRNVFSKKLLASAHSNIRRIIHQPISTSRRTGCSRDHTCVDRSAQFAAIEITRSTLSSVIEILPDEKSTFISTLSIHGPFSPTEERELGVILSRYCSNKTLRYLVSVSVSSIISVISILPVILASAPGLLSLSVHGCCVTHAIMEQLCLNDKRGLLHLDVSNNDLEFLDGIVLPNNLLSITATNNKISYLDHMELRRLQLLKLTGNKLVKTPFIRMLPMLTQAYFDNNEIEFFDFLELSTNARLVLLSLDNNKITQVTLRANYSSILILDSLEMLMLKGNPIEEFDFSNMYFPRLQSLGLSVFPPSLVSQLAASYLSFPKLKLVRGEISNILLSDNDLILLRTYLPDLHMFFDWNLMSKSATSASTSYSPILIKREEKSFSFVPNPFLLSQDSPIRGQPFPRIDLLCRRQVKLIGTMAVCGNSFEPNNTTYTDMTVDTRILQWPIPGRAVSALQSFEDTPDANFSRILYKIFLLIYPEVAENYSNWKELDGDSVSSTLLDSIHRLYIMLCRAERSFSYNSQLPSFTLHQNREFTSRIETIIRRTQQQRILRRVIHQNRFYRVVKQAQTMLFIVKASLAANYQVIMYNNERHRREQEAALLLILPNLHTILAIRAGKDKLTEETQRCETFLLNLSRVQAYLTALFEKQSVMIVIEATKILQSASRTMKARDALVLKICEGVKQLKEQEQKMFAQNRALAKKKLELELAELEGASDIEDEDIADWALKTTNYDKKLDSLLSWANDSVSPSADVLLCDDDLLRTAKDIRTRLFSQSISLPTITNTQQTQIHCNDLVLSMAEPTFNVKSGVFEHSFLCSALKTEQLKEPHYPAPIHNSQISTLDISLSQAPSPPRSLFKHDGVRASRQNRKVTQPYIPQSRSAPRQLAIRPITLAPMDQRSLNAKRRLTMIKNMDSLTRSQQDAATKQNTLGPVLRQIKADGWNLSPETAKTLALKRKKELAMIRAAQNPNWMKK